MANNKKSWDYQKNRYKQINIKFDLNNLDDAEIYHFAAHCSNTSKVIKDLLYDEMVRCAYEEA